jgi:hypothetical protein
MIFFKVVIFIIIVHSRLAYCVLSRPVELSVACVHHLSFSTVCAVGTVESVDEQLLKVMLCCELDASIRKAAAVNP